MGFRVDRIAEMRDLDGNTLLELHDQRRACVMTMEHANQRTDIWFFLRADPERQ